MVDSIQGGNSMSALYGTEARPAPKPLTDDQKSQVQSILSNYDPKTLTADDAKAIFKSIQDAGIQAGPGLREALSNAGFDAQQLRALANPEGQKHHHHHHHGGGASASTGGTGSSQGLDVSTLQSLQSILGQYDLKNLSSDQQSDLISKLNGAGLLQPGNTINLSA